jgi:hypothetical protein
MRKRAAKEMGDVLGSSALDDMSNFSAVSHSMFHPSGPQSEETQGLMPHKRQRTCMSNGEPHVSAFGLHACCPHVFLFFKLRLILVKQLLHSALSLSLHNLP